MGLFVLRVIINAIAIAITASLLPGVTASGDVLPLLFIGLVFGIVNAVIKPVVQLLSLPVTIITFGCFALVINGCMLMFTAWLVGGMLDVDGWPWAIVGGIVMGLVVMAIEWVIGQIAPGTRDEL
jgi:putative membrane protein